jgi:hypothetical protein
MGWKISFGCVIGLVLLASAQAKAADVDLSGDYIVNGTNPNDTEYKGTATIKKVGDIYRVTWLIGK